MKGGKKIWALARTGHSATIQANDVTNAYVLLTTAAVTALKATATEGVFLLHRHLHGDWGNITSQDSLQNEIAPLLSWRVLSRYTLAQGTEIWIISEADRAMTTIMSTRH
ncbi:hypothetical protein [Eoetvoesiella caeni]